MIIFGTRTTMIALAVLSLVCGFCKTQAAHRILKRVTKFTLFFIPLFPVSTRHYMTCVNCGGTTEITQPQANIYLQFVADQQAQHELNKGLGAN